MEMEADMRKYWKFLMGALLGGIVGGSLALFFAPNSGEQTRHGIEDYFKNLQNEIQKAGIEKRDELEAQLNQLRSGK
jgi:gas vesicle protein